MPKPSWQIPPTHFPGRSYELGAHEQHFGNRSCKLHLFTYEAQNLKLSIRESLNTPNASIIECNYRKEAGELHIYICKVSFQPLIIVSNDEILNGLKSLTAPSKPSLSSKLYSRDPPEGVAPPRSVMLYYTRRMAQFGAVVCLCAAGLLAYMIPMSAQRGPRLPKVSVWKQHNEEYSRARLLFF